MAGSVRPVVSVTYTSNKGSFLAAAQQMHAKVANINKQLRESSVFGAYRRELILKALEAIRKEEEKQQRDKARQKMKELQEKTGKTADEIMTDWARKRGYSLETAVKVFGGKQNLVEIITGDYSY